MNIYLMAFIDIMHQMMVSFWFRELMTHVRLLTADPKTLNWWNNRVSILTSTAVKNVDVIAASGKLI
jgi:hypothetical protein